MPDGGKGGLYEPATRLPLVHRRRDHRGDRAAGPGHRSGRVDPVRRRGPGDDAERGAGRHVDRRGRRAALAATLLAVALLIFGLRPRARARPSEWLILGAGLIALTVLLGYLFDAEVL